MKIKIIACIAGILISFSSFSQRTNSPVVENLNTVSFIDPGISGEIVIGKKATVFGKLYLNSTVSYFSSPASGKVFTLYLDPALTSQFRYYYNYKARESKGLNTSRNSMNYVALFTEIVSTSMNITDRLPEKKNRMVSTAAAVVGMQRNYKKRLSLDLSAGPGFIHGRATFYDQSGAAYKARDKAFTIAGQFSIGLWLGRRNK